MRFAILPLSADSSKLLCKSKQISLEILVVKQVHKTVRFGVTCRMSLLREDVAYPMQGEHHQKKHSIQWRRQAAWIPAICGYET